MIREMVALRWEPTHVTKHCLRVVPLHCFYISYFMDFTSTYIWVPGELPLTFLSIDIWIMLIQVRITNHHLLIP